jgi:hypothetical protein
MFMRVLIDARAGTCDDWFWLVYRPDL